MTEKPLLETGGEAASSSKTADGLASASKKALRSKAEAVSGEGTVNLPEYLEARSPEAMRQVLHELRVHQIELEMQNMELRRAQVQLDTERARYFDLYDLAPVGYCTISAEGLILETNLTAATLLGETRSAMVKQPVTRFILKEDRDIFNLYHRNHHSTGVASGCELRMVKKDGAPFWARIDTTVAQEADGMVVCRMMVRDISRRKNAEAERERLIVAIEQAGEVIVITDASGTLQYANPAFERTTGYSVQEAMRQNLRILKSGEHDQAFYDALWKTITSGRTWSGRLVNKHKDGTLYTEEATISPVLNAHGVIVNYIGVKRNITEQLKLEAQFLQAQKMESVGRLIGGVAHDFNNTLAIILGYADMAIGEMDPSQKSHGYLEIIRDAGMRSADIVRQLLAFSRQQVAAPTVLDLNDTIKGMLHILQRLIGEGVALAWQPAPDLAPIKMDTTQIDQILANLCINARDAIDGIGHITIETQAITLDQHYFAGKPEIVSGDYVVLAVSDDGCGMESDIVDKIFEPFFTTKEVGRGTGLGLSTVYGIVKQNKGVITVDSTPGAGTTFRVYLPCHHGAAIEVTTKKRTEFRKGQGETILLVEDDHSILEMSRMFLEMSGYHVLGAATPNEALRIAEGYAGTIDLLFTDVIMPEMGGGELSHRLLGLYPGLKCLYMSGYTADIIGSHGVLEDGVRFLQKPFSRRELSAKVREALDG